MRIVSWNIEWMNNWFVGYDRVAFRDRYEPRGSPEDAIADVDALCRHVAQVIEDLAPDILCVQEGPSDPREMGLFVSTYLTDGTGESLYDIFGGYDGRSQKIYVLARHDGPVTNPREPDDEHTLSLTEEWESDVDGDATLQPYGFTRRPVVVDCDYEGQTVRVVALHLKSKYVHRGADLWNNPARRPEFIREALKQRRRISAESMRVRHYLNDLLEAQPHLPVIVTGDCNDGPGADYFEKRYLTHNVTDILLGSTYYPAFQFEHAFIHRLPRAQRYTAIFDDFVTGERDKLLVLDHILVSPGLKSGGGSPIGLLNGGIGHREFERAIDEGAASERQKFPSDHRPAFAIFGP
jgi:endonuclease/exonuclease/phosphatase family metal-dependent hydrolase